MFKNVRLEDLSNLQVSLNLRVMVYYWLVFTFTYIYVDRIFSTVTSYLN